MVHNQKRPGRRYVVTFQSKSDQRGALAFNTGSKMEQIAGISRLKACQR
jgi:hypothetical protein